MTLEEFEVKNNNSKAYAEVLEIISNMPYSDYLKIPQDKIKFLKKNADKNSSFKYNPSLSFDEQNISELAKKIIVSLYLEYLSPGTPKEFLLRYEAKLEQKKRQKYNPNEIFKKKNSK